MSNPNDPFWNQPASPSFGTGQGSDVNRLHDYDDVDIGVLSHHHTLGPLNGQAASGNHSHNGVDSVKLGLQIRKSTTSALATAGVGVELKDTGIGDTKFTPINKGIYIFKYKGRVAASAVPTSQDIKIRYDLFPNSPSNTSPPLEAITIPLTVAAGGGSHFFVCEGYVICPDDLAAGVSFNFAAFYNLVQGPVGSLLTVAQSASSRRQFTITLDGFK